MQRRRFLLITVTAVLTGCSQPNSGLPSGTRLILVRHADRSGDSLSATGRARAQALVHALDGIPIDAILAPDLQRNLETAAPLGAARDLPVTVVPKEFVLRRIRAQGPGQSVIWVGNKANLTTIFEDLGASGPPPLDYGDLAILETLPEGNLRVTRIRFGP